MEIFWRRVGWWTESNALEKSIAIAAVLVAGFCWLNPVAIAVVSGSSVVVVEWRGRKPCCVWFGVKAALRVGRRRHSTRYKELGR